MTDLMINQNLPHLMAFRADGGFPQMEQELKNPDWNEALKQICRLVFTKPNDDKETITSWEINFLNEYDIKDKEIDEIIKKALK